MVTIDLAIDIFVYSSWKTSYLCISPPLIFDPPSCSERIYAETFYTHYTLGAVGKHEGQGAILGCMLHVENVQPD